MSVCVCVEFKKEVTRGEVQLPSEWRKTWLQIWGAKEKRGRKRHLKIPIEEENYKVL